MDKIMRSCSVVAQTKNIVDTKFIENRYDFEDIDEAQWSDSKGTSVKNFKEEREQSNTDIEKDFINISEILDKNKRTKERILGNISFATTQHDIYNPEFSSVCIDNLEVLFFGDISKGALINQL